jgi:hypothetical protein
MQNCEIGEQLTMSKLRPMSCCIIRKVPFKTGNRIVWGLVVGEREGMALLVVQRQENTGSHTLAVGVEGTNGIFESVDISRFPLEHGDLEAIGRKFYALGEEFDEEEFRRNLRSSEGDWWKNI